MRSLLAQDQQGEPVALVSAGCEVIQINRKFFAKYLDDNMLGIIALKVIQFTGTQCQSGPQL